MLLILVESETPARLNLLFVEFLFFFKVIIIKFTLQLIQQCLIELFLNFFILLIQMVHPFLLEKFFA